MPRPRRVDDDTIKTLEQQLATVQLRLKQVRAARVEQTRLDDTRRKIIAGAIALEHLERDAGSEWGKAYFRLLDEHVLPRDRALFEFLPRRDAPPTLSESGTDDAMRPDQLDAAE